MHLYLLFILLISPYPLFSKESSPSLYVLLACDTSAQNAQAAISVDARRMKELTRRIAHDAELKAFITSLNEKTLSLDNIIHWLHSISPTKQDVVFCYLTGHGGRLLHQQSPWPWFFLPQHREKPLDGLWLIEQIRTLSPKLAVILFDCCNNVIRQTASNTAIKTTNFMYYKPGLVTLFQKHKGVVAACSAQPGQQAYGINSCESFPPGGLFTTCLIASICEQCADKKVSWETVLQGTSAYCENFSVKLTTKKQTPYYSIHTTRCP